VAFVTGHENPEKPETALDWPALAAFPGTLVFYMGVRALPRIASKLQEGGRPADEPVAVVERGTMTGQKTVLATLATVADAASGIKAPAITVVGPVAALREELAWLEARPLHGVAIAVTRARAQASARAARLRSLGAEVVEAPAIRTERVEAELPALDPYDLLIVSSPNGAHEFFARLYEAGLDSRAVAGLRVAAIGPGTARALREHGVVADVVPERAVAEGLVEALDGMAIERALLVRGREGRDVLPDALRERGAEVDLLVLYETVAEPLAADVLAATSGADWITFTSASTVRFLASAAGGALPVGPRLASIGPATSAALREHGREPDVEAAQHTPDGLVQALIGAARSGDAGR
jgi:uroporphyrinogen III methyltransferase / synthase